MWLHNIGFVTTQDKCNAYSICSLTIHEFPSTTFPSPISLEDNYSLLQAQFSNDHNGWNKMWWLLIININEHANFLIFFWRSIMLHYVKSFVLLLCLPFFPPTLLKRPYLFTCWSKWAIFSIRTTTPLRTLRAVFTSRTRCTKFTLVTHTQLHSYNEYIIQRQFTVSIKFWQCDGLQWLQSDTTPWWHNTSEKRNTFLGSIHTLL